MFSKLILPNLERDCLNTRLLRHLNFKRVGGKFSQNFHWNEVPAVSAAIRIPIYVPGVHNITITSRFHEPFAAVQSEKEIFFSHGNNE